MSPGPVPGRRAVRAAGARAPYGAVPAAVRGWVDDVLGSPVVEVHEQVGGFSPGCATRVRCADGTGAFVKAVGAALNPDTPVLFRREVDVLERIGAHPLWAALRASRDADGWVTLVLEDVEGDHPDLADDAVVARLLRGADDLVDVLGERMPSPPRPNPQHDPPDGRPAFLRPGPVDVAATWADWLTSVDHALATPDLPLPGWVRDGTDLRDRVATLGDVPCDHAVHHDVREDNLLVRPTGEVVFVDWGASGTGPAWLDPLQARLGRVEQSWFDASLSSSPHLARAGDDTVTAWLLGMGVHLAWRAHTAGDALPGMARFRRGEATRLLGAAERRLAI